MSYSCLDYLGSLPTLDVVSICARDTAELALFRAHGAVAGFRTADLTERLIFVGGSLAGAIVLLRLAAFVYVVGGVAWRACELIVRRLRRPALRTLVERHRGRPADVVTERADPR